MTITRIVVLAALLTLLPAAAPAPRTPAPKDARVYIIWPADGATVTGSFWCRFGLRNMGVTHADDNFPDSGHHHLLIDVDEPLDPTEPIPHDKKHLHYGAGETEALVELPPGKHTLQLVLSDGRHFNFDPPVVSEKITVQVRDPAAPARRTTSHHHGRSRHGQSSSEARKLGATVNRKQQTDADAATAASKAVGPIEFLNGVFSPR